MSQIKILVVEDEQIVALDLKNRLTRMGYIVPALVTSGEEALNAAADVDPDLVLMDIKLDGQMDGVAAAQQIKEKYDVPVVYLTAYADEPTLQRAKITEPFGYLLKPLEDRVLQTTIEIALYKHSMERKLKEQERWLAATLTSIGDGVITVDPNNRITLMNPVAEKLTGWDSTEALGRDVTEVCRVVLKNRNGVSGTSVIKTVQNNAVVDLSQHLVLLSKDGTETPIDRNKSPIIDEHGHISGTVIVFHDISEHQRIEEALRRSQSHYRDLAFQNADLLKQARHDAETKTLLLHEVNHRVKNNLAAIIGLLNIEQNQANTTVQPACRAILEMLTSRIQGLATVHNMLSANAWRPLLLAELISQVIRTALQALPTDKQISVEVSPSPITVAARHANNVALLINEMMTNVIKHVLSTDEPTEVKVQIFVDGPEIVLEFRDNGPGFPEDILSADVDSVGLTLIRYLVSHSLEGNVTIHNDQGAVTTIRFGAGVMNNSD